jgi:8-oxo-dGTP pyrophosphatase MutT (NUDIX family)
MKRHHVIRSQNGRGFALFPVAVMAIVVDRKGRFLLLRRPGKRGWESVSGALERGEKPLACLKRELTEELGGGFRFRVLGPFHAGSFRLDGKVAEMVCIGYAVLHLGGPVEPGDDMAGADVRWMTLKEIAGRKDIIVPSDAKLFRRAREMVKLSRLRLGYEVHELTRLRAVALQRAGTNWHEYNSVRPSS